MAKCDLSIELDRPDDVHHGGETITGVVRAVVDADVKCSALEVQSVWRTHGRGNVSTGTAGVMTLFSGQWNAGETLEYRFELPVASWPPTYHGHHLNVDHYVDARAKIPWGFDPKASVPFQMRPSGDHEAARIEKPAIEIKGCARFLIGMILLLFFVGFLVGLALAGPFSLIFLALPLLGFLFWFFRNFLPRWVLGAVVASFPAETLRPGETARGELTIEPKKGVAINGISLLLQAREQCVSGSGSNRTTHKHVLLEQTDVLQQSTTLAAGVKHRFPLVVTLPADAPHSLDLNDNKLIWSGTLRVDLPRWPDWVRELPLNVVPPSSTDSTRADSTSTTLGTAGTVTGSAPQPVTTEQQTIGGHWNAPAATVVPNAGSNAMASEADGEEGVTFEETARHLWLQREQRDQVEMLVEAVSGLSFEMQAVVERRLLYSGDDDPHVFKDGYAVWAHYPEPPLPMVLYVPHQLADEFEQIGRDVWRGRGTVVGWDRRHGRLQVKLEGE